MGCGGSEKHELYRSTYKVYLIQSKKYAYRLKFQRVHAPQWELDAFNMISKDATIGFEDENVAEPPCPSESMSGSTNWSKIRRSCQ
jgi:hypothetical protein